MVDIKNSNFSIHQICQSGQCFRMNEIDNSTGNPSEWKVSLVARGKYIEISQSENDIYFECTQTDYDTIWKNYFDLETDYAKLIRSIDVQDSYLLKAAEYGKGIRILQQDLWEMIVSFIISQQNNIKRIRNCIRLLCEKYGEKKTSDNGKEYFDFPTPESLANTTIEELCTCNLGYRSRYIYETSNSIWHGDISLGNLQQMDYAAARKELLKLCGIGEKVADCICLFALHQTDAFPKDTHINKVLAAKYPKGFPFERYTGYNGILQQYIFYYDLQNGKA